MTGLAIIPDRTPGRKTGEEGFREGDALPETLGVVGNRHATGLMEIPLWREARAA